MAWVWPALLLLACLGLTAFAWFSLRSQALLAAKHIAEVAEASAPQEAKHAA